MDFAPYDKELYRRDEQRLIEALRDADADVSNPRSIRCPFHNDTKPSSGIYQTDEGHWKFKCQACGFGGDVFDVIAKVKNVPVADVLREFRPKPPPLGSKQQSKSLTVYRTLEELKASIQGFEAMYTYTNPTTKAVDLIVIRYRTHEGKRFSQARPVPGGFVKEPPPKPLPIYNRLRVASSETVFVVEGEKCVHALAELDIVATTNPGGALKGKHADWSLLAGKVCYLWPDNDPPDDKKRRKGIDHMREVAALLEQLNPPPSLYWIDCDTLDIPPKGDAADFVAKFPTKEDRWYAVMELTETASPLGAVEDLSRLLEDIIAGRREAIRWPWDLIRKLTNALVPGTITCICGDPGDGKSFFVLQAAVFWYGISVPFALYEMEEDRTFHLQRTLAQLAGNSELTNPEWVKANPDEVRRTRNLHTESLNVIGRQITEISDDTVSLTTVLEWIEQKAISGARVIAVDPITAASVGDKPWIEDLKFLMAAKAIIRRHNVSLVLVTHPRKGSKSSSMHDMAGGAAYQRFSQTVLWIERCDEPRKVRVQRNGLSHWTEINRSVQIRKTRNGRGAGMELGFIFDPRTLLFAEQGIVVDEEKPSRGSKRRQVVEDVPPAPELQAFGGEEHWQ